MLHGRLTHFSFVLTWAWGKTAAGQGEAVKAQSPVRVAGIGMQNLELQG